MMEEEAKNKESFNQMTRILIYEGGIHDQINQFRNQDEILKIEFTKGLELELEFFIVHKEAKFDLWDQSIHVFLICVSFLRRGIHTLKHKVSMCE